MKERTAFDLIAQLVREVRYDPASVRVGVSDSEIVTLLCSTKEVARMALRQAVFYLQVLPRPDEAREQRVQEAVAFLMLCLGRALNATDPEFQLNERNNWIQWGQSIYALMRLW